MKNWIKEAVIISVALIICAWSMKGAVDRFIEKDRIVSVKGLAEKEVTADRVSWPIIYKELGNDVTQIYNNINGKNSKIIGFLKKNGIEDKEISITPANVIDLLADRYNNNVRQYRYNVTSIITVTSSKVELVRKLIEDQALLIKEGIAITSEEYRYPSIQYYYTSLNDIKPAMIEEATKNARAAAEKFAKDSDSKLGKIKRANQGQFSIFNRDENTPYIKTVRVVTSIDYYLKN